VSNDELRAVLQTVANLNGGGRPEISAALINYIAMDKLARAIERTGDQLAEATHVLADAITRINEPRAGGGG
jgi:hypothetical protein